FLLLFCSAFVSVLASLRFFCRCCSTAATPRRQRQCFASLSRRWRAHSLPARCCSRMHLHTSHHKSAISFHPLISCRSETISTRATLSPLWFVCLSRRARLFW